MECCILMKQICHCLIMLLLYSGLPGISVVQANPPHNLVIVCSVESSLTSLSPTEIRKLFLGARIFKDNMHLRPLQNISDAKTQQIFLQKVIFMSQRSFERRLLSNIYRIGGERPEIYSDIDKLVESLVKSPASVSYMWSDQLVRYRSIKSVGLLWAGQTD